MQAVEMHDITKTFSDVVANDHINFVVKKQTIHCLLGENGSGKTTLMNILFGLYKKDAGEILINGIKAKINSPADAERLGIGMVHQHFMLVDQLSVWQNVILGKEPGGFFIDQRKARDMVKDIVQKYNFKLDLDQRVTDISIGMKQRAEIVKLLYMGADIIIFDEPTAVLTPQEAIELFGIFDQLVEKGKTVIFITHKMHEIFKASEYVTVLRKGKVIGTVATRDVSADTLAQMMVGHQVEAVRVDEPAALGEKVLELRDVALLQKENHTVSFSVNAGEIVGIAGVDGNGQMELEETIIGLQKPQAGELHICGQEAISKSVKSRKQLGIGYIPSDRVKYGIMPLASIRENFMLGYQDLKCYRKGIFQNHKALDQDVAQYIRDYEIKLLSPLNPINSLSGGNQQKVVLAREVGKSIKLLIAAQPIRGLDIGAIEYVHKELLKLRKDGVGILLISAELSELMDMSDRIIVLYEGKVTGTFSKSEFSEDAIGLAMMGGETGSGEELLC